MSLDDGRVKASTKLSDCPTDLSAHLKSYFTDVELALKLKASLSLC